MGGALTGGAPSGGAASGGNGPASGRALADSLVGSLIDDLLAESAALRQVLAGLAAADWGLATPAAGWTVTD